MNKINFILIISISLIQILNCKDNLKKQAIWFLALTSNRTTVSSTTPIKPVNPVTPLPQTNSSKDIYYFNINSPTYAIGVITGNTISISLNSSFKDRIVASFGHNGSSVSIGGVIQTSEITMNNFNTPQIYTVKAEDGTTKDYTVTVNLPQVDILSFSITSPVTAVGVISGNNITVNFSSPTIDNLVATFSHTGLSVLVSSTTQVSGVTPNNFNFPVHYIVLGPGGTSKVYTVTVNNSKVATPIFGQYLGFVSRPEFIGISTTTIYSTIYFTLDGTIPTIASSIYSSYIHVWSLAGRNIKAFATKSGLTNSGVLSGMYSYPPLNTGQTINYTYGDDRTYSFGIPKSYYPPFQNPSYPTNYTTTDNSTGLVWKTCNEGLTGATCSSGIATAMNYTDANTACTALNSDNGNNGYSQIKTWRVPNKLELETLIHHETNNPSITTSYFPNTSPNFTWTSSDYLNNPTQNWLVSFNDGKIDFGLKSVNFYVRCVSGFPKSVILNFTDKGDGTIRDNSTFLTWQKCLNGLSGTNCSTGTAVKLNWIDSVNYCNSLPTILGTRWRMPNINELSSIIDLTRSTSPTINTTFFPNTALDNYWSSTTYSPNTAAARVKSFQTGLSDFSAKTGTFYVRCVSFPDI